MLEGLGQLARTMDEEQEHREDSQEHVKVALEEVRGVTRAVPTGHHGHLEVPRDHRTVDEIGEGDQQGDVAKAPLHRIRAVDSGLVLILDEQTVERRHNQKANDLARHQKGVVMPPRQVMFRTLMTMRLSEPLKGRLAVGKQDQQQYARDREKHGEGTGQTPDLKPPLAIDKVQHRGQRYPAQRDIQRHQEIRRQH